MAEVAAEFNHRRQFQQNCVASRTFATGVNFETYFHTVFFSGDKKCNLVL